MSLRSPMLYRIQAWSVLHKIRHDLAGEITVAFCSVILAATFFYVFRDFLQEQVKQLSDAMFHRFAEVGSHLILAISALTLVRSLRRARQPDRASLAKTAKVQGEEPAAIRNFQTAWLITMAVAIIAAGTVSGSVLIGTTRFIQLAAPFAGIYGLVAIVAIAWPLKSEQSENESPQKAAPAPSLFTWRLRWWYRTRLAHLCLVTGMLGFAMVGFSAVANAPSFVPAIAAYAAGLLWAIPMTFQLAADLEVSWVERSLGVSHQQFFKTYDQIGLILGGMAALITAGLVLGLGESYTLVQALSAAGAAATPALVEPGVMFQIDGRRPAITIMILILVSLFIATAIIAHPLSLLLLVLVKYYARTSQEGRFYRA